MKRKKKRTAEEQHESLATAQSDVFRVWQKLEAFGILLERQGVEHEGFVELHGLGLELQDLGEQLQETWRTLDTVNFKFAKFKIKNPKSADEGESA